MANNVPLRSLSPTEEDRMRSMYREYRFHGHFSENMVSQGLNDAKENRIADVNFINDFENWFEELCMMGEELCMMEVSEDCFQKFKTLVSTSSTDFTLLHNHLYSFVSIFEDLYCPINNNVSLISSDRVVFEIEKSVAKSLSPFLSDVLFPPGFRVHGELLDSNPVDEIPVQVSSLILNQVISFCKKKNKFSTIIQMKVKQLINNLERLIGTVNDYKGWVNTFVKSNKPLFSYLHQAADYLHIPTLLELTSMCVGDMKDNSVQDISDWYQGVSIPSMLSPLWEQAHSLLSHFDSYS